MAGWKPKKQIADGAPAPLMIPLLDLTEQMCRWPCGDPRDAGFGFCGHEKALGVPYCEAHQRAAWSSGAVVLRARKAPMKRAA